MSYGAYGSFFIFRFSCNDDKKGQLLLYVLAFGLFETYQLFLFDKNANSVWAGMLRFVKDK